MTGRVVHSSWHATAGESERILGFRVSGSSLCMSTNVSNSSGSVDAVACARVPAVSGVSATASSSASVPFTCALHTHACCTQFVFAHG